ncbi:hypothetical protein DFQ28_009748 [Apophysomyces sp. BC1034]|nr:hypothetical protein DFQ29_004578 [Apophysomyces sp. BC1021]KAG0194541.1 hypothetical protein DFQ28_009748 [Apophysomyces sp. BC1034]
MAVLTFAQDQAFYVTSPLTGTKYTAGQKTEISWNNGVDQSVTVRLIEGSNANTMQPTSYSFKVDGDKGSYEWKVPSNLPSDAVYALQFQYKANNGSAAYAYSDPFSIQGGNSTSLSSSLTKTSGSVTVSASASASASATISSSSSSSNITASSTPQTSLSSTPAPLVTTSGSTTDAASFTPTLPATETPRPDNGAKSLKVAIALVCIPAIASALLI